LNKTKFIQNFKNMNRKLLFLFLFLPILGMAQISSTQQQELKALNNYLHFTNESIHGMMTAHRLFEIFNQTVNKYVDLESNQLNMFSNADLSMNIFDDPAFMDEMTAYQWYAKTKKESSKLPNSAAVPLNIELDKLKTIITRINTLRFELENLTNETDLKERKNLTEVYKTMEECVTLYEEFHTVKKRLKSSLQKRYATLNIPKDNKELGNLIAIHENIRAFLEGVRAKDNNNLTALIQHLKNNLATAKSFKITDQGYENVLQKASAFINVAQKYLDGVGFPKEYKLYGRTYYYYNMEMVAKFNHYGSGLVKDLNEWVASKNYPALVQLEEPHYFKVIYPKKEVPKIPPVETIKPASIPQKLDDRAVVIKQNQIMVSPGKITIEVYDHQLADGDIISLNYNGHWILKDYQLRRRARKMTLPLKPDGDNYLILHAVNLGTKPPNTATLSYTYKGERKSIVMESNMNESEMIKIQVVK